MAFIDNSQQSNVVHDSWYSFFNIIQTWQFTLTINKNPILKMTLIIFTRKEKWPYLPQKSRQNNHAALKIFVFKSSF